MQEIFKDIDKEAINICFGVDENYALYASVVIKSILANSKNSKFNFFILYFELSKEAQEKLKAYENQNISVNFIDVNPFLELDKDIFFESAYIKKEAYLRIFIPLIFSDFERILYLDSDVVVLRDIAELYNLDFEAAQVIAVADSVSLCWQNENTQMEFKGEKIAYNDYLKNILKLQNPKKYFNSGVLLYNIPKCQDLHDKALNVLEEITAPLFHDQDILNAILNKNCKIISEVYNYMLNIDYYENLIDIAPKELLESHYKNIKDATILHYAGVKKPWNLPHLFKANLWWEYARKTPYYEEILFKMLSRIKICDSSISAVAIVKSHLSYRLGKQLVSKNPLKILLLPLSLPLIILKSKLDKSIIKQIRPTKIALENCSDYKESLKIKQSLSYRLGNALVKNPLSFIFKIPQIFKEYKKDRDEK